ncbi:MAG: flavin oxidoreductase/NADH oxidase [Ruminococcaceae bacterium]|nr:flavin oxidoreductase/NADH oxidase [Oscillospiraceae bacterium]
MKPWRKPTSSADLPASIPYTEDISILARPIKLGAHTLSNRICYQPMEGCDGTRAGAPDELTVRRYLRFAKGGAGLIWFEATAIVPEGRANPRQMYLSEETKSTFASLVSEIKETCLRENGFEPVVVCQLTHSGRWSKPQGVPAPLVAYNKPIFEGSNPLPPTAIVTDDYLDTLAERYVTSAKLAREVGFDGVDIKACHGYLLSELLNAYLRDGKYGGTYENRTRLFMNATEAVRAATPGDFIIGSRFNAYDGYAYPYGMGDSGTPGVPDLSEAARIAADLEARGATLLNVTMGCPYTNHEVNRPTVNALEEPPYRSIERMLDGARAVAMAAPRALVVSSGLSFLGSLAPNVSAAGIAAGDYHIAGFGRQTFSYPELARDITKSGGMDKKKLCLTCGKCTQLMRNAKTPGCVIYDKEVYMPLYKEIEQ